MQLQDALKKQDTLAGSGGEQVRQLEQTNETLEMQLRSAQSTCEKLQVELDHHTEDMVFLKGDLDDMKSNHLEETQRLTQTLKETEEEVAVLKQKGSAVSAVAAPPAPTAPPTAMAPPSAAAGGDTTEMVAELERLRLENEELAEEVAGLEGSIEEMSEEMEKMTEELQEKAQQVRELDIFGSSKRK